jgi:hypothetical protein
MSIEKKQAMAAAEEFCRANGLAVSKLHNAYSQIISDKLYFAVFPDIKPSGLLNDIETQPVLVLVVHGDYIVTKTEYTEKYLGK